MSGSLPEHGADGAAPRGPAIAPALAPAPDLAALFAPRGIAVVGASPRSDLAPTVRDNLRVMGSPVPCHFVNPKYDSVFEQSCYPSLTEVPGDIDLVVIGLGPARVAAALREAARCGVRAAIIPGGGVVELGEAAAAMQAEVGEVAAETGIALLGPNCMGFVDYTTNVAAYIGDVNPWQRRGGFAGIAQSGSVTDAFIHAAGTRLGWSRIISCGAEVALDLTDYMAWCLDDPATDGLVLFIEGFKRPERFLALADRALELGKPVLAVKVGRSPQAQAAAIAHSGSLAGEALVVDAALDAAGVQRFSDLDELLEAAELNAGCRRLGRGIGRGRVGLVTVSTGEASLVADLAPAHGVDLPPVPEHARERILRDLPTLGYVGNPLDPWGASDAESAYAPAFEAFAESGAFDVVGLVHDFPYRSLPGETALATELSGLLAAAVAGRPGVLPVYVSLTSGDPTPEVQARLDAAGGIPLLRGAREALAALGARATWERRRARRLEDGPTRPTWPELALDRTPMVRVPPADGPARSRRLLPERESLELLAAAGLPVTRSIAAVEPGAAVVAAEALGWPVVMKVDALGLPHKSDVGGIRLGLRDPAAARLAFSDLVAAGLRALDGDATRVRGVLVQPQAEPGVELIVGLKRDPQLGPAVLVGLGGVYTEVLADVAVRLAPLREADAYAMLDELRGAAFLRGIRGGHPADLRAIVRLLVTLGRLGWQRSDLVEVDLNPVIATPSGCVAVDALVVVEEPA